ncbi:MAG: hypothetical protein M3176_13670 [Chloroflexota bacterium]|nr:hypothetical protein [Chloroflexota bacterium]
MRTIIFKNCTDVEAAVRALDAELQLMPGLWESCGCFTLPSVMQSGALPQFDVAFMLKRVAVRYEADTVA